MELKNAMVLAEQKSKTSKSEIGYANNDGWIEIYETYNENGELDYNLDGVGKKVVAVEATKNGITRKWY